MNGAAAYAILGVVLVAVGVASVWISKRTGEVHSLWFGQHPENIERFERIYLWAGVASVLLGALVVLLGAGNALIAYVVL